MFFVWHFLSTPKVPCGVYLRLDHLERKKSEKYCESFHQLGREMVFVLEYNGRNGKFS
jgi:hypothetical protein